MSADPIIMGLGSTATITRAGIAGWHVSLIVNSTNKLICFTDSVDLIDWLSGVFIASDGGKKEVQKDTLEAFTNG